MTSDPEENGQPALVDRSLHAPEENLETQPGEQVTEQLDLEKQAKELAQSHTLLPESVKHVPLTRFLGDYARVFERATSYFQGLSEQEKPMPVAAEWMLDNNYIVLQTLRELEEDLPLDFYRELPSLQEDGLPRIYHIANVIT